MIRKLLWGGTAILLAVLLCRGPAGIGLEPLKLTEKERQECLKAAWKSLVAISDGKSGIDWRTGEVTIVRYEGALLLPPKNRDRLMNKELVSVTFHTELDSLLGPIVVLLHPKVHSLIGFVPQM
ncbi:hypothetical protein [Gorillibacterium sp. sgz5001074]|uniref:hypothetical protein n=1 Tax=Gorillibacterium sp. sgz5001074 TaxID=3446695 RepID=UPI003F676F85